MSLKIVTSEFDALNTPLTSLEPLICLDENNKKIYIVRLDFGTCAKVLDIYERYDPAAEERDNSILRVIDDKLSKFMEEVKEVLKDAKTSCSCQDSERPNLRAISSINPPD